ncbi:MAG: pyruvate kinase [Chitinophagales bacterium]|jgi:pyruvate kinase|nr:pyruvate kinase [Sphingobacteriales bacterium]
MILKDNKTKIIATYGPACESEEVFENMIKNGVDVFRFNFSHGDYEFHLRGFQKVKDFNKKYGTHIAILADLQGPKIRVGEVENGSIILESGLQILVTNQKQISTIDKLYVSYDRLGQDVNIGEDILVDDGKIKLQVLSILDDKTIKVIVLEGGELKSKKGVNFPHTKTTIESLTKKDRQDLEFAINNRANWIALSFVRKAEDILEVKKVFGEAWLHLKVISKIEKPEAIENIDSIIEVSDGIMVARGDLAIEVPLERVPLLQKEIVKKCNKLGKPVIVATQMMESMTERSFPTRAEISDVANAVLDGADALMLSGETSVGLFPVKVIETMSKIIEQVETNSDIYNTMSYVSDIDNADFIPDAVCHSAVTLAEDLNAKAIIGITRSGYTGFRVSSFRPKSKIYIFSDNKPLLYTMSLIWGVKGFYYEGFEGTDQTIKDVIQILKDNNLVKKNDLVINTASMPFNEKSKTNTVKVTVVT